MAEFMFPNVAYRATVYRTGVRTLLLRLKCFFVHENIKTGLKSSIRMAVWIGQIITATVTDLMLIGY